MNPPRLHAIVMPFKKQCYYDCVKDLDPTAHVGGIPLRAIVIEIIEGHFSLYKANLRPDYAINLARSLAKNEERHWYRIHCVNQKLKTRVDTISRVEA